jgi:hypothetical protein
LTKDCSQGEEISDEDLDQMTMDQVKDVLDSYTSVAEKWANHVLTCQKAEFNLKRKESEDAFRDLLISAQTSSIISTRIIRNLGFNIEVANPKNTWFLNNPRYVKWISVTQQVELRGHMPLVQCRVMELSEIIESIPDLTKEEIDHLNVLSLRIMD